MPSKATENTRLSEVRTPVCLSGGFFLTHAFCYVLICLDKQGGKMRVGRKKKYLLWLAMLTVLLILAVVALVLFGSDAAEYFLPGGLFFGMELSSGVLMVAAFISECVADYDYEVPKWEAAMALCGFIGFAASLYLMVSGNHGSFLLLIYIPALTTILNTGLIFLVQTFAANRNLGLPLWQVMPVHVLFALWIFFSLVNSGDTISIVMGAFVVLIVAVLMLLIEMMFEWRERVKIERLGKIYS